MRRGPFLGREIERRQAMRDRDDHSAPRKHVDGVARITRRGVEAVVVLEANLGLAELGEVTEHAAGLSHTGILTALTARSSREQRCIVTATGRTMHEQVRTSCLRLHDPDCRAARGHDQAAAPCDPAQLLAPRAPRGRRRVRDDRGARHDGRRARLPRDVGSESRRHHRQGGRPRLLQQRRRIRAVALRRPSVGRRLGDLRRADVSRPRPRRRPAGDRLRRRRSRPRSTTPRAGRPSSGRTTAGPDSRASISTRTRRASRSKRSAPRRPSPRPGSARSIESSWRSSKPAATSVTGSSPASRRPSAQ